MKKRLLITWLVIFGTVVSFAQQKPFVLNGKILNPETLEPINSEFYHDAYVLDNGRIDVRHGPAKVWGQIDWQGNQVVKPRFFSRLFFNDGIAIAGLKGFAMSYLGINEQGEKLFDLEYENVRPFKQGMAAFQNNERKFGFLNAKGNVIVMPEYDEYMTHIKRGKDFYFVVRKGDDWGIVNAKNKVILPFKYQKIIWLKDDLFLVGVPDAIRPTSKGSFGNTLYHADYGVWSASNGMMIEPTVDFVNHNFDFLKIGYLKARLKPHTGYTLIDLSGKPILNDTYDELTYVSDGLLAYGKDDAASKTIKFAIGDFKGNLKTNYELFSVGILKNGLIPICAIQGQNINCGYVDENIKLKIPLNFIKVREFDDHGFAIVSLQDFKPGSKRLVQGVIDKNNNIILPIIFDKIELVSQKYFVANAMNNGFEHLIDTSDGNPIDKDGSLYLYRLYASFYAHYADFENAAVYYQKIIDYGKPESHELAELGKAYARSGQYELAHQYLDQILKLPDAQQSDELRSYGSEKAFAYWKEGKTQEAKQTYEETLTHFTKTMTEEYSNIRLEFAELLKEMNLGHDAIEQYKEVLRFYTSAWGVYDKLGVLQLTIDMKEDAITSFNKSIGFNPNGKDAYFYRGQAYAIKKEFTKAIADYEIAIQIDGSGELTTIHGYLADSYFASGDKDKACSLWKQMAPYSEKYQTKATQHCK